jgi:lipopolysaccharide/colanic/teichoic acid biosynthesis glycosyltransferase
MHFTKDMQKNSTPVGALAFDDTLTAPAVAATHQVLARAMFGDAPHNMGTDAALYSRTFKRVFDLACIVLAAPLIVPVIALLAMMVAIDGGKPFYRQARVGRDGRIYTMWKLRTMVAGADAKLEAHLAADPAARTEWDSTQKLKDDPRITRFGRMLRKTSLDELPQLFNVIKGEMSLVGPRPMLPEQQEMYPGTAYYDLLPGITGPWQVSARNETTFAARAYFDTRYARTLSFVEDLRMLASTVRVVTRATGH